MPEPHATAAGVAGATATSGAIVGAAVAAIGPVLGPYLVISVLAFFGAFVALSVAPTSSMGRALLTLVRGVIVAAVATGSIAAALSQVSPGFSQHDWLGLVAFAIGLRSEWAIGWILARVGATQQQEPKQ
jgi:hypothetical protein